MTLTVSARGYHLVCDVCQREEDLMAGSLRGVRNRMEQAGWLPFRVKECVAGAAHACPTCAATSEELDL